MSDSSGTTDGHRHAPRSPGRALVIFAARLLAALAGSTAFGLVAAAALPQWSIWTAFWLAFGFGFFFVGGTGYRILLAVARGREEAAAASWSGAAAGSALYALLLAALFWTGGGSPAVLAAYGLGINLAYGCVKTSCALVGCCEVDRRRHPWWPGALDLRLVELALAAGLAVATLGLVLSAQLPLAAIVGIGGHTAQRLASRWLRSRHSTGWPPLRQPGAELAPLYLLTMMSIAAVAMA